LKKNLNKKTMKKKSLPVALYVDKVCPIFKFIIISHLFGSLQKIRIDQSGHGSGFINLTAKGGVLEQIIILQPRLCMKPECRKRSIGDCTSKMVFF